MTSAAHVRGMSLHAAGGLNRVLRRRAAAQSLLAFARIYLPAHFLLAPSEMHQEVAELLQHASKSRGQRIAIAAPRGHAKTTLLQAYVLWCICLEREQFIMLISNTIDQASDCLSMIKQELQSNMLLLEDFPEACEAPGVTPTAPRWRKEEIITRNGVKVTALGAEKKIRGRKHNQHRPTLIILDDVENETEVRSADQRANKLEWFNKAVLKAGSAITSVIVAGTILHYDSLLSNLLDPQKCPGWVSRKYQAVMRWSEHPELWERWQRFYTHQEELPEENQIDGDRSGPIVARAFFNAFQEQMLEGTTVLWPELEDYYQLMEQRLVEGRASFDSEKQNEPVNPDDCFFPESEFVYWDDKFRSVEELIETLGPDNLRMYGACDPSLGRFARTGSRGGDYSAMITLARDKRTGTLYVIDADIKRRKPDELIDQLIEYQRIRIYTCFGIEANQFQKLLCDMLLEASRQRGVRMPVKGMQNTTDKEGRIQRLQALISAGKLQFTKRHTMLLEQLRQFPMGAHDDGPDALEMAVQLTERQWAWDQYFEAAKKARFSVSVGG